MRHSTLYGNRFFFATAPMACPYLPDRVERRVVTELVGRDATHMHDVLSAAGYRRSHGIAYAPACPGCSACVAVRIVAPTFKPSRGQRRVWNMNSAVIANEASPTATEEQYALFATYQNSRHGDGDMAKMSMVDYQTLVEDTPVETTVVEFRDPDGSLVAACLTDRVGNGLSAVYSYFDGDHNRRSLGTYMILWLVERARDLGLDHVYLGFWVAGCSKMSYKTAFQPLEGFTPAGWRPLGPGDGEDRENS